jgi:murein DD-endopeptidase MepM/ murein hydrolase activator NlpD
MNRGKNRFGAVGLVLLLVIPGLLLWGIPARAALPHQRGSEQDTTFGVQTFLEDQPGVLKTFSDNGQAASAIIEGNSLYYGISPSLHLALLETVNHLLSDPVPTDAALRQPYGPAGPQGFAAQMEWASRELRAGLGPYDTPPTLHFTDGTTFTLTLEQAPEGVAVQRFLAIGRTSTEWRRLVDRFALVFQDYFNNELLVFSPSFPTDATWDIPQTGFLQCPWPPGMPVVHLAYFDHTYPTVDTGPDGNSVVVTYAGVADVQYNTHDGHDYVFPANPIGSPILAAAPGLAYARTARGNGVVILHPNGYETVYWHLNHFAPRFRSIVDGSRGIWVETGDILGTSGTSGFDYGTPHLHFEVRYRGKQVDPYGWHGPGPDPCEAYAACEDRGWLWHSDLYGLYDFTPPDHLLGVESPGTPRTRLRVPPPDQTPPVGTLSINPPDDLLLLVRFDGHLLQEVGQGGPAEHQGAGAFAPGRYGQALDLSRDRSRDLSDGSGVGEITFPISGNMRLEAGSISLWAKLPDHYPPNSINRHYLLAASANPQDSAGGYAGTLALRRDNLGPDHTPRWNFWTVPQSKHQGKGKDETGKTEGMVSQRDDLAAPDTLPPGWHHLAITWDRARGNKTLYFDGERVAATTGVTLPLDIGPVLHIGRFTYGGSQSGVLLDDLAVFGRVLADDEIAAIASATQPISTSATVVTTRNLRLDTNASDRDGSGRAALIVAMQPGLNGAFAPPQPYSETLSLTLPPQATEQEYTVAVRYFDRASNRYVVTHTVLLDLPPRGDAAIIASDAVSATLALTATDLHQPIEMQLSASPDFAQAMWEPLQTQVFWQWPEQQQKERRGWDARENRESEEGKRGLWVRFRDGRGNLSEPLPVTEMFRVHLPRIFR